MDLTCTWMRGGMIHHMETGKYRQVIGFDSNEYKFVRSVFKYEGGRKCGKLKDKNGNCIFNYEINEYEFNKNECKVEKVIDGLGSGEWISIPFGMMMLD